MVYLRKILVTTDLSDFSLAAIEYAASFGLLYSSKLYLLHVADTTPSAFTLQGLDSRGKHCQQGVDPRHTQQLEEFALKKLNADMKLTLVVRNGVPADEIQRFAEEEGIDLIVMATHGRTGLKHIVLGSVAEKVVRLSTVPVLTVKPHPLRENILQNEDIESELHLH
jgi:nucleotide-binding universal stress UspA family protein